MQILAFPKRQTSLKPLAQCDPKFPNFCKQLCHILPKTNFANRRNLPKILAKCPFSLITVLIKLTSVGVNTVGTARIRILFAKLHKCTPLESSCANLSLSMGSLMPDNLLSIIFLIESITLPPFPPFAKAGWDPKLCRFASPMLAPMALLDIPVAAMGFRMPL